MTKLEQALRQQIDGEVHFDTIHKKVYSVDASIYEIEPLGIVVPKTKQELIDAVRIAAIHQVPVIARGAATGITGGCIGKALIIDTSKYLNRVLEIDYNDEYARCEPGVVQDFLNEALKGKGFRLGPDTSTGNRATLGGMAANNAAGSRSLYYGTMADHILELKLLLASGEILHFGEVSEEEFQEKLKKQDIEGRIYQTIDHIRKEYRNDIEKHFPHIPRRVSGYNLDSLLKPGKINICRLIAGSEGSLGIITEIKVRISKKPVVTGLCLIQFKDMLEGMTRIPNMLLHKPMAIEMIDDKILEAGRNAPSMIGRLDWIEGQPQAVFIAEFSAETEELVSQKLTKFALEMQNQGIGFSQTILLDKVKINHVWDVRKAGLGLLLSKRSYNRAIAFLEDVSVAPEQLASFMRKFRSYLQSKNKDAGIYGHVGSGCMHIRPYIDLRKEDEVRLMEQMMHDVSDLLLEHGGVLSGEHGDGLVRSWLNKKMFGDRLYHAFEILKQAFDPENRMNPGKVVNGPSFLENLRLNPQIKDNSIRTFLDFSREGGFELAADLCNGNGLCRKKETVMCPSFQATNDEFHSTRARAQALRSIIHQRLPIRDFTSQGMHDVMDLCLECKGCKTECPSEIDMAKMKAEFLYHYQREHGIPLRSHLFAQIGRINQLGSYFPELFNRISKTKAFQTIQNWLGITTERTLPEVANETFSKWFKKHPSPKKEKTVVLYNDTFTEFNHPEIGKAATEVLEALGYQVIVPKWHCCGRPAISKGKLPLAKSMARTVIRTLSPYAKENIPIIGLEPSCILTIKDDYFGLLGSKNQEVETVISACETFDEFIAKHIVNGKLPLKFNQDLKNIKVHGHCHQKALVGMLPTMKILKAIPGAKASEIPSGCCGLAGSFGYEKEHYDISMKIGQLHLFPEVNACNDEMIIIANGMSCRGQIKQGTGKPSQHIAEVLLNFMDKTF